MIDPARKLYDVAGQAVRASAEFPDYEIFTQRTYGGVSLVAVRRDGVEQPGVYAVITGDPDELRGVLDASGEAHRHRTPEGERSQ